MSCNCAASEEDGAAGVGVGALGPVLAQLCDGYSGADIKQICRDAAMAPMRRLIIGKSPEEIRRARI